MLDSKAVRGITQSARHGQSRLAKQKSLFDNNRDDCAPRSAVILRDLLDRAGIPAAGGIEPPPTELTLFQV